MASPGAARASEFSQGDLLGQFRITGTLGAGGMARVYRAEHVVLKRVVAIKVLAPELARQPETFARFVNEARAATRIGHPGVVAIEDVAVHEPSGQPYIVMELIEGSSLAEVLTERVGRRLTVRQVIELGVAVAEALAAAHAAGIVHRDVKPDNIIVVRDGEATRIKVLDFGIAKIEQALGEPRAHSKTMSGAIMGTPAYMSPEQLRDTSQVDARSDIYSLGCVLYEAACGRPPFTARTAGDLFAAHLNEAPPALRKIAGDVPTALESLIHAMLEKQPRKRPHSMAAVVARLEAVRATLPAGPIEPLITAAGADTGGHNALARTVMVPPTAQPWSCLAQIMPPSLRADLPLFIEFFGAHFDDGACVDPTVVQLGRPRFANTGDRPFFATFVASTVEGPLGQVGAQTFLQHAQSLTDYLRELTAPAGSVFVTVLDAMELGQGVRDAIFAYRRQYGVIVVPLYVGELRRAHRLGQLRLLLQDRIADLHAVRNPFAMLGPMTDTTRCLGVGAEVNELIELIRKGGRLINVIGLPGAGKTTVINLAEYGCEKAEYARMFVYVSCAAATHRNPLKLAREIQVALKRAEGGPAAVEPTEPATAAEPSDPATASKIRATVLGMAMPALAGVPARRLVVVVEDADWLISMASAEPPVPGATALAQDLFASLAELCKRAAHTVIVTSVRDLAATRGVGPVPTRIALRALAPAGVQSLVDELGTLIQLRPDARAIARLNHWSAGNVFALRSLCSEIVDTWQKRPDHSPLAPMPVQARDVDAAAATLAVSGPTFRDQLLSWVGPIEEQILHYVATSAPRSPRRIRRALGGDGAQVGHAVSSLQAMGVIGDVAGRQRIAMPLLEAWIKHHLDTPAKVATDRGERRLRYAGLGLAVTALMLAFYGVILAGSRDAVEGVIGDCHVTIDFPARMAPGATGEVQVLLGCAAPPRTTPSFIAIDNAARVVPTSPVCTDAQPACAMVYAVTVPDQHADRYGFEVHGAGGRVRAEIAKDSLASIKDSVEASFKLASFLPLILGLFLTFFADLQGVLRRLRGLGRGVDPGAAAGPPEV
jgi:tRNA A-37 threonylcarbamoyl transferase component Bud32